MALDFLIANPKVADAPGALQRGVQFGQQRRQSKLAELLATEQVSQAQFATDNQQDVADRAQALDEVKIASETQKYLSSLDETQKARELEQARIVDELGVDGALQAEAARPGTFDPEDIEMMRANPDASMLVARAALAGGDALPDEDNVLVEIADPTSPTGTRMVRRADAVGQPGKPPSGTSLTVGPDGTVQMTQGRMNAADGNMALDKVASRAIQAELAAVTDQIEQVNEIASAFDPNFLTYQGRASAFLSGLKDKANAELTPEELEFLEARTRFETRVERMFNAYRKEITGAAASVAELDRLKKAILNTDLGPAQFRAQMQVMQEELLRAARLKRRLLREGISVQDEQFGDTYDRLYLNGADDSSDARLQELLGEGMSQDEALDQMIREGYE